MAAVDHHGSSPAAAWGEHCRARRLAYQVAPDGTAVFPPRLAQPGTGAPLRWAVSAGRGEVHATTVVRRRGEPPRNLALVTLDEGFRMMSTVVGLPPEDVAVGLRVRVAWRDEPADGDVPVPVFESIAA
jgi:uncharacterized OB-fold protein